MSEPRLKICWWTCFPTVNQTALVDALRRCGADVVVCYYRPYDDYRRMIGWREAPLKPGEFFARSIAEARRQIADFDSRLPCVPSYADGISWRLIGWCLWHRRPWFASVERSRGSWKGWLLRKAFAVAVNLGARRLFAVGRLAVEQWKSLGVRSDLVRWTAYALPPAASVPARAPRRTVRFAYVGALTERKAVDVLAAAWKRVDGAELLVVGDGPLRGCFDGLANVELIGAVPPDEVQAKLADADAIVLPSRFDAWGVALAEGAQMGLAMIASDGVGAAELVEPGFSGAVVKAGDVDSLASAMIEYVQDRERLARAGEAARRAAATVDAGRIARNLCEALI